MKIYVEIFALLLVIATTYSSKDRDNKPYKVVCYYGSWAFYRPGDGKFAAEDANPNICTHMVYAFAKLNSDNTIGVFDPALDLGDTNPDSGLPWGRGMYRRFNHLRTVNPHMKTMISIGGLTEGSTKYSKMVSNPSSRKIFVDSVMEFLKKYKFDGLDFDWQYPTYNAIGGGDRVPGNDADKRNFIELLKELHDAFQPHGYVLSAAVSAGKPTIDRAYDVPQMNKYLDMINLMTYDFHIGSESKTAHHAPLYPRPDDSLQDREFTTQFAVDYYIKLGAHPKKIVMGMPLYGRTFTLASPSNFGIGAPAVGAGGAPGPLTRAVGTLGYNEICQYLKSGNWKVYREKTQKVPYAVSADQWIGFDDKHSIKDKTDFIKRRGLGGGMVWAIDLDDFKGLCGKGKYPLLKTISKELNRVDGPDSIIEETLLTPTAVPNPVSKDRPIKPPSNQIEYNFGSGAVYDEVKHVYKLP